MSLIVLPIAIAVGFFGYRQAASYATRTGRHAWGLPPIAWALIFSCSLLVGAILFRLAIGKQAAAAQGGAFDGVTKVRPLWLLRTLVLVVGLVVGLVALVSGFSEASSGNGGTGALVIGVTVLALTEAGRRLSRTRPDGVAIDKPAPPDESGIEFLLTEMEDQPAASLPAPVVAESELLSTTDAAGLLGVSPATVRRLVAAGDLAATRDGRVIRIERDEVLRLSAVR
ncbi:MAG: Helix-turn-helix domain [Acidimicrobiales bacterium]|jgi:excisionase family DNA binding protein|nr:Helix-turn-helix domain [Acidimicrobiales bacterium]